MAAPVLLTHIYRQLRERAVLGEKLLSNNQSIGSSIIEPDHSFIGLDLMAISRTVEDPNRRTWITETLNNLLRMWEYNM